jgi:hypothetical protein
MRVATSDSGIESLSPNDIVDGPQEASSSQPPNASHSDKKTLELKLNKEEKDEWSVFYFYIQTIVLFFMW